MCWRTNTTSRVAASPSPTIARRSCFTTTSLRRYEWNLEHAHSLKIWWHGTRSSKGRSASARIGLGFWMPQATRRALSARSGSIRKSDFPGPEVTWEPDGENELLQNCGRENAPDVTVKPLEQIDSD